MIDIRSFKFNNNHIPIIPQICNNIGMYGAGYSGALSSRWPKIESSYKEWFNIKLEMPHTTGPFQNGENQYVNCGDALVVNMIAQNGVRSRYRPIVISYIDLMACLFKLSKLKFKLSRKFYFAKIGSGLAGGDWNDVKYYINLFISDEEIIYL